MHKWKYKVTIVKLPTFAKEEGRVSAVEDKLNRLGIEGWELVNALSMPEFGRVHLYMKRAY